MSIGRRAVVTAATLPLVGVALWATGAKESFVQPFALFIAYFFPPRFGRPLTGLFVATYASPLLYESADGYPSRVLTFAAAVAGMNVAIHLLEDQLLHAEARQRVMAERDPLTGLANRRTFDAELARAVTDQRGVALVVFDLDGFKAVNDELGHPVGDAVLGIVAGACAGVVREGDCLARIGGDEFAVVAPGAGVSGVGPPGRRARGRGRRSGVPARGLPRGELRLGGGTPRRAHGPRAARLRRQAPPLPQARRAPALVSLSAGGRCRSTPRSPAARARS